MERPCWTLNHATEGIGRAWPQLQRFAVEFAPNHANALAELPRGRLPEDMTFPVGILARGAKLTDLITAICTGNLGFLISDRFKGVLKGFRLSPHRCYPAPLEHRGQAVDGYSWLYLPQLDLPLTADMTPEVAEKVIAADPLVAFADLIRVYSPERYRNCFISNPLRIAMEEAGITGVRFGTAKIFR